MKNLTIAALALSLTLATSAAFAQGHMKGHHMMKGKSHMAMHDMMMKTAMMGLSADEKQTAMMHMQKMTPAEKAVMMKRCSMCMKDKHAGMDMSTMDEKKGMAHMMSGLSMSEQKTMKGMWMKMSAKEKAVGQKMAMNCCMYGMKHGK